MSASLTGEWSVPLVQRLNGPRAVARASSPASRITASSGPRSAIASLTGNGQALDAHRRCVGAIAKLEIIGRHECVEYFEQMSGDGDSAHRVCSLPILDPKTGRSTTIIAGHHIDADTDKIGDIEPVFYVCDELVGAPPAGVHVEIARTRGGHRRCAALGMTSRDKT